MIRNRPGSAAAFLCSGLLALVLCTTCLTSTGTDRAADVAIQIQTLAHPGVPLPFTPIGYVGVWHGAALRTLASGVQSDSIGLLTLHDTLSPLLGPLDSVKIRTYDPKYFCTPAALIDTVVHSPRSEAAITLPLAITTSKLAPGEFCGSGLVPSSPSFGSEFDVHLQIDSITDSIRGVWQIAFVAPIATQAGSFSGVLHAATVELHLESTSAPPCGPRYRFLVAASVDSTLGVGYLEPAGGCATVMAPPFRLVVYDAPQFP